MDSTTQRFEIGDGAFYVTRLKPEGSIGSIVFAAGRGGSPTRYAGLLQDFADRGFLVVAPHCDMLKSQVPTRADLADRGHKLTLAMIHFCPSALPLYGVGHSIGAMLLLVLAGAQGLTLSGEELAFSAERRFDRLALFTPPTDFFRRPGALSAVVTPMKIWAGGRDKITPPEQSFFLKNALRDQTEVELLVVEEAGHFAFMDELPPNIFEPHPARADFLRSLAADTSQFLSASKPS